MFELLEEKECTCEMSYRATGKEAEIAWIWREYWSRTMIVCMAVRYGMHRNLCRYYKTFFKFCFSADLNWSKGKISHTLLLLSRCGQQNNAEHITDAQYIETLASWGHVHMPCRRSWKSNFDSYTQNQKGRTTTTHCRNKEHTFYGAIKPRF